MSETAATLDMPNLKTAQDMILLAHADHLIDDNECLLLYDVFGIPEEIRCYNEMVFDKEEPLCVFLKRFAYPCRYQDLMLRFEQRAVCILCIISSQVQNIIYENWRFLMRNLNQNWLSRRNFELFAEVIHTKGAPLGNCWGFVDGTTRPVCRPGQNQRLLYNGHKRYN